MQRDMVLHAGPPIDWQRLSAPVQAAAIGAIMHEGLAADAESAERMAARGEVRFEPCHHHQAVGPMAGMTTYSMPVLVVENRAAGNRAYSILNEGLGRVLRYGGLGPDVLERLDWMRRVLGPALGEALRSMPDGVDLRALIAQALHMGDECHNRNRAASALLIKAAGAAHSCARLAGRCRAAAGARVRGGQRAFLFERGHGGVQSGDGRRARTLKAARW